MTLRMNGKKGYKAVGHNEMEKILTQEGQYFSITLASQPKGLSGGHEVEGGGMELWAMVPRDMRGLLRRFFK